MKAKEQKNIYGVSLTPFEAYKNAQKTYEGLTELSEKLSDTQAALIFGYDSITISEEITFEQGDDILNLLAVVESCIDTEIGKQQDIALKSAKKGKLIK